MKTCRHHRWGVSETGGLSPDRAVVVFSLNADCRLSKLINGMITTVIYGWGH